MRKINAEDELIIRKPTSVVQAVMFTEGPCHRCGAYIQMPGRSKIWTSPCINKDCAYDPGACPKCGHRDGFEYDGDTSEVPDIDVSDPSPNFTLSYSCKECGHGIDVECGTSGIEYNYDEDDEDDDGD